MINARYDLRSGAWVNGYLFLPSIGLTIEVPFLIDTGSGVTSIAEADLEHPRGNPLQDLPLRPGPKPMIGVGGTLDSWSFLDAGLAFLHDSGGLTHFVQPFAVISTPGIPSLLGRDVLAYGSMQYEGIAGSVTLEFEQGLFRPA